MANEKTTKKSKIPAEKAREYTDNRNKKKKEMLQKRKNEKKNGATQNRRLAFIVNIMNAYGIKRPELAARMKCTPQSLYWIFSVTDDCTISKAEEMFDAMGLVFKVGLQRKEKAKEIRQLQQLDYTTADGTVSRIVGNVPMIIMKDPDPANVPQYIKNYPSGKRLTFLARYLEECAMPITKLEDALGLSHGALRLTFISERDDTDISKIYDIAKITKGEISWIIEQKEK